MKTKSKLRAKLLDILAQHRLVERGKTVHEGDIEPFLKALSEELDELERKAKTYRRYLITDKGTISEKKTTWAVPLDVIKEMKENL